MIKSEFETQGGVELSFLQYVAFRYTAFDGQGRFQVNSQSINRVLVGVHDPKGVSTTLADLAPVLVTGTPGVAVAPAARACVPGLISSKYIQKHATFTEFTSGSAAEYRLTINNSSTPQFVARAEEMMHITRMASLTKYREKTFGLAAYKTNFFVQAWKFTLGAI
jgi:hypothetical protein